MHIPRIVTAAAAAASLRLRAVPNLATNLNNTLAAYETMVEDSGNIIFDVPFEILFTFPSNETDWNAVQLGLMPTIISSTVDATLLASLSTQFVDVMGQVINATNQQDRLSLLSNFLNTLTTTQFSYKSNFTSFAQTVNLVISNYDTELNKNLTNPDFVAFKSEIDPFNVTVAAARTATAASLDAFLTNIENDVGVIDVWALLDPTGSTATMPAVLKTLKTTGQSHYTDDAQTLNDWSLSTWTWIEEQI